MYRFKPMQEVAQVNFATVEADFPGCQVMGVAEYFSPTKRWTQLFEEEILNQAHRPVVNQIMLAMLAGATKVSLQLKDPSTGRNFAECYTLRELVN